MFTIKHITLDDTENLIQSKDARYSPAKPGFVSGDGRTGQSGTPATLWTDNGPLTGGTIFVMNESGKTVARYDLGASNVPLEPGQIGGVRGGGDSDRFPVRAA